MKRIIRYRSVYPPKKAAVMHKRNRGSNAVMECTSLDDLITASRIVEEQKKGLTPSVKIQTKKATVVASHVAGHNKGLGKVRGITERNLNRIIIEKNSRENKPTEEVKVKYLKLIEGE